ncbi:hypothetical protein HJC23_005733 [Cyclotella cryptica]|uniref:Uncharacterized protein n=1 Tax=Cyclotella cryptica TaxID=29204 RepID=A0ABD3QDG6_9STRA|eukprot:CCRYP_006464-RA/>CCRYP_006464-RA protein AED:0.09 eAED:0.09 QI:0/-1/0/1/-1/1/1/0/1971
MEYSSTKKVRLPGISTLLVDDDEDDNSSYDSHEYREEITPRKTANGATPFQTPPPKSLQGRSSSTRRQLKRSTLSPSSNQIIRATAEALAAHPVEGATIGRVIIDTLDDFGESVWNRLSSFGERASRAASETSGIEREEADDDGDGSGGHHENGMTVYYQAGYDGINYDNEHENADDSATHSLSNTHVQSHNIVASPSSPPQEQAHASLNTTQSTEDSFYIGLGEEGFCPSMSIHESDISESGSDDGEEEEEAMLTEEEEYEEEDEGEAVNMSILTEYIEEESRGGTARQAEKRTSAVSSWEDEKKEEPNEVRITDGMTIPNRLETEDQSNESRNRTPAIPPPLSRCHIAPSPQTLAPHQQADTDDDNSLESKEYVSSSLKNYLSLQEDKLSSLLSSIEGLTATPARIQSAVQDDFSKEEDLDSEVSLTGLMTPLRSRLERVELNECEENGREEGYRGGMGPQSPLEFDRVTALNEDDASQEVASKLKMEEEGAEHRNVTLLHSPPGLVYDADASMKASGSVTTLKELHSSHEESKTNLLHEEAEHRGGMLLHSPSGLLYEDAALLKAPGLEKTLNEYDSSQEESNAKSMLEEAEQRDGMLLHSQPALLQASGSERTLKEYDSSHEEFNPTTMHEEAEHRGGMLLHSPPSHVVSSSSFSGLEIVDSSTSIEQELIEETMKMALPQSPLVHRNKHFHPKDGVQTPSAETNASPIASPLEIAAAEFSTKSTELMEYLQQAMKTERTANSSNPRLDISKPNLDAQGIQEHLEQSVPTSLSTLLSPSVNLHPEMSKKSNIVSEESDDIPASLREMFRNAESILEKELSSPVLKGTRTRTDLADISTFCEDYIKPPPDSKSVEDSPIDCVVIDTANLNRTESLDGTGINLDSLKGAFLKAESQLESAASSIVRGINPRENANFEDDGEDDTTFDTANFSLGGLAAAVDDFFDAREFADAVHNKGNKSVIEYDACAEVVKSTLVEKNTDKSMSISERKEAVAERKDDAPMIADGHLRMQTIDDDHFWTKRVIGDDEDHEKTDEDENVDITLTLERVGDYLKRMAMGDQHTTSNSEDSVSLDALTYTGSLSKTRKHGINTPIKSPSNLDVENSSPDQESIKEVFSTTDSVNEDTKKGDITTPRACNASTIEPSSRDHTNKRMDSPKDFSSAVTIKTGSPAMNKNEMTPREGSATNLALTKGSDDMDESMFMPNVSMEVLVTSSPIPVAAEQPLQAMSEEDEDSGALSDEEFFPNRDLSRKATSKAAASCSIEEKTVPAAVKTAADVPACARSSSLGGADRNATGKEDSLQANSTTRLPSKVSRLPHPIHSKSRRSSAPIFKSSPRSMTGSEPSDPKGSTHAQNQPRYLAASASACLRQCNRKAAPPTSPPSNVKPARKRTKLSTITNTNTSDPMKRTTKTLTKHANTTPKCAETMLSVPKSTATHKQQVSRAATGEVDVSPTAASTSLSTRTKAVNTSKSTKTVAVSPRSSSIRRSLVAVTKSQRQSNIPKPKTSPPNSVHSSERLTQLAKPRAVFQKDQPPSSTKNITKKTLAAAKPPSLLSRESKKSRAKSTKEREAEQMSTIQPFKAKKIKGSSSEVRSRFNTPRAPSPNQTRPGQSNPKPFVSLREAIDKYNFREPAAIATPNNPKRPCERTPSFLEREMYKPPKKNVPTFAESIKSYDFRGSPIASTPVNPKARPPSFLNRSTAMHLPKSSEELELEECKNKFKACPLPLSSTSKMRPPSRPREGGSLTTPRPPKLHTSMRSGQLRTPVHSKDEIELSKQFHARPLPVSLYGSRFATGTPIRHYERTPQPSTDEVELSKKFHALPLPTEIYGTTIGNDGTPFHIRAEQQYERAQERKRQLIQEEMEELRRSRERKATPLPKTNWEAKPIIIEKSDIELVQPRPPRLSLDVRSRNRRQFDEYIHQVREADAAAKAAKLAAEAEAEEAEIRRKRSLSIDEGGFCFRARPISIKYE